MTHHLTDVYRSNDNMLEMVQDRDMD